MSEKHFDAIVVGAGPAGSIAALVLARGGARVALIDKSAFPRDKACGDLIGPRGVQLLHDLDLRVPEARRVGDMVVVGPTGNRVRLPATPGRTYPGYGIVVKRSVFDATLQQAAVAAGAEAFEDRADEPIFRDDRLAGFVLSSSTRVCADAIVGADGATSRVADVAGLVEGARVLWGFALRAYIDEAVGVPHILFWTPSPGAAFPGYGWAFPSEGRTANVGLGVGVLADRAAGRRAARDLNAFLEHAADVGVLAGSAPRRGTTARLGGWLKMGLVGTTPARDRVFLVGDAAGLVNPLQGEGIAQAMGSGRAAADAMLAGFGDAHRRYGRFLGRTYAPYLSTTAALQRVLLPRPRVVAAAARALTMRPIGNSIAGGWALTWNDLRDGASRSAAACVATTAAGIGRVATSGAGDRRWIAAHVR